jgi:hypothetical protein
MPLIPGAGISGKQTECPANLAQTGRMPGGSPQVDCNFYKVNLDQRCNSFIAHRLSLLCIAQLTLRMQGSATVLLFPVRTLHNEKRAAHREMAIAIRYGREFVDDAAPLALRSPDITFECGDCVCQRLFAGIAVEIVHGAPDMQIMRKVGTPVSESHLYSCRRLSYAAARM